MKLFLFIIVLSQLLLSRDIHPTFKLKSQGIVSDFVVVKDKIYIANDEGSVDIFDLQTQKIVDRISLNLITSKMDRLLPAKILSVDYLEGKLLIVSIGEYAFRNVWLYENYQLKQLINESAKLTIKEARFITSEQIMLGTFASEIILHDTSEEYSVYKRHVSQSTLGDIALSDDKKTLLMSDESGEVQLIDVQSSKTLKTFSSQNVDNVYHVAYENGVIVTAGQDRRVAVYRDGYEDYHIKSDFLVYCVGLTPSGKTGVYSSGQESDLQLFDIKSKRKLNKLVGHSGIVTQIKFINEKELFSNARDNYVYFWRLD